MMQMFRANVDLYETDREVVAKFDLPGVKEDDIFVSVENDSLIIRVEKAGEREEQKENALIMERSYAGYYRSISLPPEADQENVGARYEDGVLTVRFPIKEGFQGRHRTGEGTSAAGRAVDIPVSRSSPSGSVPSGRSRPEAPSSFQQRLSRDDMMRQGTDSPIYRSGSGSYYSDTFAKPSGEAAPEAYFGEGSSPVSRASTLAMREADVAKREADVARREALVSRSIGSGSTTIGISSPQTKAPFEQRLSREEMMRQGSDSPLYHTGSGSYYSETFERPTGDAAPQSSFGGGSPQAESERRRKGRVKGPQ